MYAYRHFVSFKKWKDLLFIFIFLFLSNQDALSRPTVIVTLPLTMRAGIGALFNLELL